MNSRMKKIPYPAGVRGNREWEDTYRRAYLTALDHGLEPERAQLKATQHWYDKHVLGKAK